MPNETVRRVSPAFKDERGIIANVLEEPINHVAIITSKEDSVRGNHYHPEQIQYVYLVSGRYESVSKDLRVTDARVEKVLVEAGSLVITPPMIAHAMRFLEDSTLLNLTTGQRESHDYPEHTKEYKLL